MRLPSVAPSALLPAAAAVSLAALAYGCHAEAGRRAALAAVNDPARVAQAVAAAQARRHSDTLAARVDTVRDTVLATVTRWRTATASLHTQVVAAAAARDTVTVVRLVAQQQAAGDSVVRACTRLVATCDAALAAKDSALTAAAALAAADVDRLNAARTALARAGRRWSLGVTVGPALSLDGRRVVVAPAVAAGLTYRAW